MVGGRYSPDYKIVSRCGENRGSKHNLEIPVQIGAPQQAQKNSSSSCFSVLVLVPLNIMKLPKYFLIKTDDSLRFTVGYLEITAFVGNGITNSMRLPRLVN